MARVVLRAYLLSDRVPEPLDRDAELGLELRHLPARGTADHRNRRRADAGSEGDTACAFSAGPDVTRIK